MPFSSKNQASFPDTPVAGLLTGDQQPALAARALFVARRVKKATPGVTLPVT
jgi:hypothetical protein